VLSLYCMLSLSLVTMWCHMVKVAVWQHAVQGQFLPQALSHLFRTFIMLFLLPLHCLRLVAQYKGFLIPDLDIPRAAHPVVTVFLFYIMPLPLSAVAV